jgi:ubiquinol-cytochrome c reductase iron-sulfur subunit
MADIPQQAQENTTEVAKDQSTTETRRCFFVTLAEGFAIVGAACAIWPLIDSMAPSADVLAEGAPLDLDLSSIEPSKQKVVQWRERPIFVVRRTPEELKILQEPQEVALLADPNSDVLQQPSYAKNWHRSIKPEYLVLVGTCTHLGCVPQFKPRPGELTPNWPGGYFCPCHGSKYDLAGRVYKNVPAPYNLAVPPYRFVSDKVIRVGEDPKPANSTQGA